MDDHESVTRLIAVWTRDLEVEGCMCKTTCLSKILTALPTDTSQLVLRISLCFFNGRCEGGKYHEDLVHVILVEGICVRVTYHTVGSAIYIAARNSTSA
jgi:hypothetical protein